MNAPKNRQSDDEEQPHRQLRVRDARSPWRAASWPPRRRTAGLSPAARPTSVGLLDRRHRVATSRLFGAGLDGPGVDAEQRARAHRSRAGSTLWNTAAYPMDRQPERPRRAGSTTATGRWMPCPFVRRTRLRPSAPPLGIGSRWPSSSSVYLRCQKSSRLCDLGDLGEVVLGRRRRIVHSSVRPSHGSSPATSPRFNAIERSRSRGTRAPRTR